MTRPHSATDSKMSRKNSNLQGGGGVGPANAAGGKQAALQARLQHERLSRSDGVPGLAQQDHSVLHPPTMWTTK